MIGFLRGCAETPIMALLTGVLTISDGCACGEREDVSGRILAEALYAAGHTVVGPTIIPDDEDTIVAQLLEMCRSGCDLVLTTGGTGFSPRDVTPEATRRVIQREAPGVAELLRSEGYGKLDRAVLSRGVSGIVGRTLIVNLPGSPGGVRDGFELLLPLIPHACALIRDEPVDHTQGPRHRGQGSGARDQGPGISEQESESFALSATSVEDNPPAMVDVIETNIDDLNPEFYELLMMRLFDAGAVDVYLTSIQMKKQRPATLVTVLAPPIKRDDIAAVIFAETGSLGLRYATMNRITLNRRWETVETEYGAIRIKIGSWRGSDSAASPEYEDAKAAALLHSVPIKKVYTAAMQEYRAQSRGVAEEHTS